MTVQNAQLDGIEYSLLSDWEIDAQANYNDTEPYSITLHKSQSPLEDPTLFDGWGTTPTKTNPVSILINPGDEHNGVFGTGFVFQYSLLNGRAIQVGTGYYILMDGFEIHSTRGGDGAGPGIQYTYSTNTEADQPTIKNILIRGSNTGTSVFNTAKLIHENCIAYVFDNGIGFIAATGSSTRYYNCGVVSEAGSDGKYAFRVPTTSTRHQNCWAAGNFTQNAWVNESTDGTSSNNASSDTTAPGANFQHNIDSGDFENYPTDLTPAAGQQLQGTGTSPPVLLVDIAGNTRNDPDDIGPFAVVGAPAPKPTIDTQPSPQTVTEPAAASMTTAATDATSSQWRKGTPPGGADVAGETGDTITWDPSAVADSGDYYNRYTNVNGFTDTNAATLTVNAAVSPPTNVDTGGPWSGFEGVPYQLNGSFDAGSDPNPTILWGKGLQTGGDGTFSATDILNPIFTPTTSGGAIALTLTVTNTDGGGSDFDSETFSITATAALDPVDISQSQAIDAVSLTVAGILTANPISQGQAIDAASLSQALSLAVNPISQAQALELAQLLQAGDIGPRLVTQAQSIDQATLTISGMVVDDLSQGQIIQPTNFSQAGTLTVLDLVQGQAIDGATLTQSYLLPVVDISQTQAVDATTVDEGVVSLLVDGISQAIILESPGLTQYAVLNASDLTQGQVVNSANVGDLTVGTLDGVIILYATLDSEIIIH